MIHNHILLVSSAIFADPKTNRIYMETDFLDRVPEVNCRKHENNKQLLEDLSERIERIILHDLNNEERKSILTGYNKVEKINEQFGL